MTERRQILSIQYLRAIAALMVVAHHGRERLPWLVEQYPYKLGQTGVDIFFVISGFVMIYITHGVAAAPTGFLKDRITRIVPLYWAATLLLLVALIVAPSLARNSEVSLSHLVLSMLFIFHKTEANTVSTFLIVGWTLNYEMMFYGLLTASMLLAGMAYRAVIAALAITIIVSIGFIVKPTDPVWRALTDEIMLEFVLGMGIASAYCRGWFARLPASLGVGLLGLGAIGLVIGVTLSAPQSLVIGLPAAAIVAGGLIVEARGLLSRSRVGLLLADASYAIYLFNLFAIAALGMLWSRLGLPMQGWTASLVFVTVSLVVGGGIGVAAHLWLEKPMLRMVRGQWTTMSLKRA